MDVLFSIKMKKLQKMILHNYKKSISEKTVHMSDQLFNYVWNVSLGKVLFELFGE